MYPDDEKLVSQTLSGDRDAFGVLVHKYQGSIPTCFRRCVTRQMHRMSRKRSFCGHIAISINCGIHIISAVGSIQLCPTSATAGWCGARRYVNVKSC